MQITFVWKSGKSMNKQFRKSLAFQPSQPLPCILSERVNLSNTRASVLTEGEEFLVVLYGFGLFVLFLSEVIIYSPGRGSGRAKPGFP